MTRLPHQRNGLVHARHCEGLMVKQALFILGLIELFLVAVKREFKGGSFGLLVLEKSYFGFVLWNFPSAEKLRV